MGSQSNLIVVERNYSDGLVKEESLFCDYSPNNYSHKQRGEYSQRYEQVSLERGMSEYFFVAPHLNGSLSLY